MTATATLTEVDVPSLCADLRKLQRQRAVLLQSRNMQSNRLQAVVAGSLGYTSTLTETERLKLFRQAGQIIKDVRAGKRDDEEFATIIRVSLIGIDAFNKQLKDMEKLMVKASKRLPVAAWVNAPEQRGFGLLFLAIVVGECGDLSGYANPGKLWRRMGCAPWSFDGQTHMGATWRSGREGKLPAEAWQAYGYNPRRRSIAYLIGEGLCKQNMVRRGGERVVDTESEHVSRAASSLNGHMRRNGERTLDIESASAVPATCLEESGLWSQDRIARERCPDEDAAGADESVGDTEMSTVGPAAFPATNAAEEEIAVGDSESVFANEPTAAGPYRAHYDRAKIQAAERHPDWSKLRCHRHGMLLATKRLLRNLWRAWHGQVGDPESS